MTSLRMTLRMGILLLAVLGLSSALICPDGGMCVDRDTCCKNVEGGYGCCPLPNAECCSDHLHCCYEGTLCDLVHKKCVNKTVSLPWMRRLPAKAVLHDPQPSDNVGAVICPDHASECPDGTTCCQLVDGSWGCCPLVNAVCCEDKLHCCPQGTKCDLSHSKCVSASLESFPMMEKLPSTRRQRNPASSSGSVMCPGGKSSCPSGSTCCQLASGDYGCCPYSEAKCCSDHVHCCPSNTVCDLDHQLCRSGETHLPMLKKSPALRNDVVCPDGKSVCPDETTCCKLVNGSYGCCPMPNAVCCLDYIHCCPEKTRCDVAHGTCLSSGGQTPMVPKIPAAAVMEPEVRAVPCNGSVACADGETCCKNPSGEWACCPLPKAVCCEDHLHCCPHGTVCNLPASTCDSPLGGAVAPWLRKGPTFPLVSDNNKCDESSSCPGESTCCKTPSGAWGCCPLPKAVCCDDHTHCCPHGTVCNTEAETCEHPSGSSPALPWVSKVPALQAAPGRAGSGDNMCDAGTSCPKDTTCCFMERAQQWGCCPLPDAVCCEDGAHCCPSGHTCDPHRSACSKGPHVLPWFSKLRARTDPEAVADVKCDDKSSCAAGTTCCKLPKGNWGCCPLVKAVCCADHEHCCPHDYSCNMQTGTCEKKELDGGWSQDGDGGWSQDGDGGWSQDGDGGWSQDGDGGWSQDGETDSAPRGL